MAYVQNMHGTTMYGQDSGIYDPDVELLGRRRKKKRSKAGLKRKLKKAGLRKKIRARLKKAGLRKKLRTRLKKAGLVRKLRARLRKGKGKGLVAAATLGPLGLLARRIKKRRALKAKRAALQRVGAAAIAPEVEAEDMIQDADVEDAGSIDVGETAVMSPGLAVRRRVAAVAQALTAPEDEGEEGEEGEYDEGGAEGEGEVEGVSAGGGGIVGMIKRQPLLLAIPAGVLLMVAMSGKRGAGARA